MSAYWVTIWIFQTIINDVNEAITAKTKLEDKFNAKLELEKTLLLTNYGPLCLNPKPSIAIANQKLHYSKYFFNTHKLRYKARKHTLLGIATKKRQEQLSQCLPSISNLIDFIANKKASQTPKPKVPRKLLTVSIKLLCQRFVFTRLCSRTSVFLSWEKKRLLVCHMLIRYLILMIAALMINVSGVPGQRRFLDWSR